jgi:putative ABC transport system permease protein
VSYLALGVLVMTVGLIRTEAAGDLRTLTAAGASSGIRRTIVGATVGAIGLLGAIMDAAAAAIAAVAGAKSSPSATLGGIPAIDFLLMLVGLPTVAAVGGRLLGGRDPAVWRAASRLLAGNRGTQGAGGPVEY